MKVLFVGNSHTFFNDMPQMLSVFGKARGMDIFVVQNTSGGRGLDWQANQFDVRFNVLFGGYDYIVMQHIAHPFGGEEELLQSAGNLMQYVSRSDAAPIAFLPWSEENNPQGQAFLNEAHNALVKAHPSIKIAPIGLVWDKVRNENPEIQLYYSDGEHAAPHGSWLIAATIFRTITGETAAGLPSVVELGRPTYAGLTMEVDGRNITFTQDWNALTCYDLDPVACGIIARAIDSCV